MRPSGFTLQLVIAPFVGATGSSTVRASDLENRVVNPVRPLSAGAITSAWDWVHQGLCAPQTT